MTRPGVRQRSTDIDDAVRDALEFCEGLDEAGFSALAREDRRTYRALKNVLAEIGEAVKALPVDVTERHPGVDWRGWAGLRDVVAHQYFSLELVRLRPAIVDELPVLGAAIRAELTLLD